METLVHKGSCTAFNEHIQYRKGNYKRFPNNKLTILPTKMCLFSLHSWLINLLAFQSRKLKWKNASLRSRHIKTKEKCLSHVSH